MIGSKKENEHPTGVPVFGTLGTNGLNDTYRGRRGKADHGAKRIMGVSAEMGSTVSFLQASVNQRFPVSYCSKQSQKLIARGRELLC